MELPEEDVPEERIWHHSELMEQHIEMVESRRRSKMAGGSEEIDIPPAGQDGMVANELSPRYRK